MARYQDIERDQNKAIVPGAKIYVLQLDGATLASLTDDSGNVLPNPVVSDPRGLYYFNAAPGTYWLHHMVNGRLVLIEEVPVGVSSDAIFKGDKGDPGTPGVNGGAGSSAGFGALFVAANGMAIDAGVTRIRTSGYSIAGLGGADYIYRPSINAAYVAMYPRAAFLAADGRGFRLDPYQAFNIQMFGGAGDCVLDTSGNIVGTPTDNLAAFDAYWHYSRYYFSSANGNVVPAIHFGVGAFYFSARLQPYSMVRVIGVGASEDQQAGTIFRFPDNSGGVVVNTWDTGNDGLIPIYSKGGAAVGSTFEGIYFLSRSTTKGDVTKAGCWMRTVASFKDCVFDGFAGPGMAIVGTVGATGMDAGGPNGWLVEDCAFRGNRGASSFWVKGNDANAGKGENIRIKDAYGIGILDQSALGNTYINHQINGAGEVLGVGDAPPCRVFHLGKLYKLVQSTSLNDSPVNNPKVWHYEGTDVAASAYWPQWAGTTTYYSGAGFLIEGASNQTTAFGQYNESINYNSALSKGIFFGGVGFPVDGSNCFATGFGSGGMRSANPIGTLRPLRATQWESGFGNFHEVSMGDEPGGIFQHLADKDGIPYRYARGADGDMHYMKGTPETGGSHIMLVSGPSTTTSFGRGSAQTEVFHPARLALGNPDSYDPSHARFFGYASAPPSTSGVSEREVRWNDGTNGTYAAVDYWIFKSGAWVARPS